MTEAVESIRKVETVQLHCTRCGYTWLPRDPEKLPRTCAGCGSPYWDRPRRVKKSKLKA